MISGCWRFWNRWMEGNKTAKNICSQDHETFEAVVFNFHQYPSGLDTGRKVDNCQTFHRTGTRDWHETGDGGRSSILVRMLIVNTEQKTLYAQDGNMYGIGLKGKMEQMLGLPGAIKLTQAIKFLWQKVNGKSKRRRFSFLKKSYWVSMKFAYWS